MSKPFICFALMLRVEQAKFGSILLNLRGYWRCEKQPLSAKDLFSLAWFAMSIGERLRQFRESLGKSQQEMADLTEIPLRTYSSYETSRTMPKTAYLLRLTELGCHSHWLLTGEGSMRNSMQSPSQTMSIGIDEHLFKDVAAIVQRAHAAFGIDLPGPALLDLQIKRYNRVARVAPELRDGALAMLEQDLVDELADARANPGQGKRAG